MEPETLRLMQNSTLLTINSPITPAADISINMSGCQIQKQDSFRER